MPDFEHKGHLVIIEKQRNVRKYNVTILNTSTRKIVKTWKDLDLSLRNVKITAKDYIGF